MIKANELRVGNYLNCTGLNRGLFIVGEIRKDRVLGINEEGAFFTDLEPIPLTEEWLIKFGFQKVSERNYQITANDFDFIINVYYTSSGGAWFIHLNDCRLPYHTVHQLQNLYFSLSCEELTLK